MVKLNTTEFKGGDAAETDELQAEILLQLNKGWPRKYGEWLSLLAVVNMSPSTVISRVKSIEQRFLVCGPPDTREAARIPILDMFNKVPSPKARVAMNNDMVKPIPHNDAAPKIDSYSEKTRTSYKEVTSSPTARP